MKKQKTDFLVDSPQRYGVVTRLLHWAMAYLLIWQFITIFLWRMFQQSAFVETVTSFGPYHGTVGLFTLGLVVVRAIWAGLNRTRRPSHDAGPLGYFSRAGHIALYVLMFVVPALAIARSYGSGKGWNQWDIQLIPATGVEVTWLTAPANLMHSALAWLLAVLMAGHIFMALFHQLIRKDRLLRRMAGPLRNLG